MKCEYITRETSPNSDLLDRNTSAAADAPLSVVWKRAAVTPAAVLGLPRLGLPLVGLHRERQKEMERDRQRQRKQK